MQRDDHPFPDAPPRWRDELRETFQLALPLVLANLAQTAIYSTDVIMVGWLGAPELAASALAVNLYSVLLFTGTGLITAAAPLIAAELGARRHSVREVRRTVRMAIWAAVLFCLPAWLLLWHTQGVLLALGQDPQLARQSGEFMRALQWALLPALVIVALRNFVAALGNAGIALAVVVAGIFINAALDWGLIFGHWGLPKLGLVGAGIASSITSYLMMFVLARRSCSCTRRRAGFTSLAGCSNPTGNGWRPSSASACRSPSPWPLR